MRCFFPLGAQDEPLAINTARGVAERRARLGAMLERVGKRAEHAQRHPHMVSGGQRQRIVIARAMMLDPAIVVADEPVWALDVSIQAQILDLFMDLHEATGTADVVISHNLSVVDHVAHDVMVMHLRAAVESGPKDPVLGRARYPCTQALPRAVPALRRADRRQRIPIVCALPSPLDTPAGCADHERCSLAQERCRVEVPPLRDVDARPLACHRTEET